MRNVFISASLLASSAAIAATPVNGWYAGVSGGYSFLPINISTTRANYSRIYHNAHYNSGYHAAARFGYKSNPIRYDGEITYIKADLDKFYINSIRQTRVDGESNAIVAMANMYYDFPLWLSVFEPYIGVGLGFAWTQAVLNSHGPLYAYGPSIPTHLAVSNGVFAYQATGGLTYDFSENYALNIGYRYIGTQRPHNLGKIFQAHLATVGVVYRFDEINYK